MFLKGKVAQAVGEYFELINRAEEAHEEYSLALDYYDKVLLENPNFNEVINAKKIVTSQLNQLSENSLVRLGNWLKKEANILAEIAKQRWFTLEEMAQSPILALRGFPSQLVSYSMRSLATKRGKLIDIGAFLGDCQVVLLLFVTPIEDEKFTIKIQVRPASGDSYLPDNFKLILVYESGNSLKKEKFIPKNNFIELEFTADIDDQFTIQLILYDNSITEKFIV